MCFASLFVLEAKSRNTCPWASQNIHFKTSQINEIHESKNWKRKRQSLIESESGDWRDYVTSVREASLLLSSKLNIMSIGSNFVVKLFIIPHHGHIRRIK